jgi:hypothetical protein
VFVYVTLTDMKTHKLNPVKFVITLVLLVLLKIVVLPQLVTEN